MDSPSKNKLRPKTGDLSTPPRDRLIPVRDVASLLGCTESEIERMAEHMGLTFEPLPWRGVYLTCLPFSDALALHLAMRAPVDSGGAFESAEAEAALQAERERADVAERELGALRRQEQARERLLTQAADRLNDLELIVAERGRIDRELEAIRAQLLESQARARDLANRLQIAEESRLLLEEQQASRVADEAEAREQAEQALAAQEALQSQWLALRQKGRRDRQADRLRSLRRTLELASLVERNLENYCDRLEQRLLDHGVTPLPEEDWAQIDLPDRDWSDWNPGLGEASEPGDDQA